MMSQEPYNERELISSLVESDMMNRNKLGEEETKETSGRRKRTCKGPYRRTLSTRTQRKASVTRVQS